MIAPPWHQRGELDVLNFNVWFQRQRLRCNPVGREHDGFPLWVLHQICTELWQEAQSAALEATWQPIIDEDIEAIITAS
jgi:hypothetical protein